MKLVYTLFSFWPIGFAAIASCGPLQSCSPVTQIPSFHFSQLEPPPGGTTTVFDKFEGSTLSAEWGTPVVNDPNSAGSITFTTAQSYSGNSSIQFNWAALTTSSIYLPKPLANINSFNLRFAVKWSPGFQFTPGTTAAKKIWRTFGNGSSDDIVFVARKTGTVASGLRFSLVMTQMYSHGRPSNLDENVGTATLIETDKWYCFDWRVVGGLGTGIAEGWINGVKKWDYTNLYATSSPMILFDLGGNISPDRPTINQTEWFDNVGFSTSPLDPNDVPPCKSN